MNSESTLTENDSVKFLRHGMRKIRLTSDEAKSFQPDVCYIIPMTVISTIAIKEQKLIDELDAWDAASEEALQKIENDGLEE